MFGVTIISYSFPFQESIEFANGEVTEVELSSPTLAESLEHTPSQVLRAVSRQAASKVVFAKEVRRRRTLISVMSKRGKMGFIKRMKLIDNEKKTDNENIICR